MALITFFIADDFSSNPNTTQYNNELQILIERGDVKKV